MGCVWVFLITKGCTRALAGSFHCGDPDRAGREIKQANRFSQNSHLAIAVHDKPSHL